MKSISCLEEPADLSVTRKETASMKDELCVGTDSSKQSDVLQRDTEKPTVREDVIKSQILFEFHH